MRRLLEGCTFWTRKCDGGEVEWLSTVEVTVWPLLWYQYWDENLERKKESATHYFFFQLSAFRKMDIHFFCYQPVTSITPQLS